jgi:hypothetical protein
MKVKKFKNFKVNESLGNNNVNVIIVIGNDGIIGTPKVIVNDEVASAEFENIARELLGDDVSEVNFISDNVIDQVNRLLEFSGISIDWFVDVEVNDYVNEPNE